MPLRDHFRSPLDDLTSWEGFHGQWPAMIVQALVRKLPSRYTPMQDWPNPRLEIVPFPLDIEVAEKPQGFCVSRAQPDPRVGTLRKSHHFLARVEPGAVHPSPSPESRRSPISQHCCQFVGLHLCTGSERRPHDGLKQADLQQKTRQLFRLSNPVDTTCGIFPAPEHCRVKLIL